MTQRTLRDLCSDRAYKFGHFVVEFATPGIGHILKGAGCDFVLFDSEHSGFSSDVVKACVRYFEAAQLPAIYFAAPTLSVATSPRVRGSEPGLLYPYVLWRADVLAAGRQ